MHIKNGDVSQANLARRLKRMRVNDLVANESYYSFSFGWQNKVGDTPRSQTEPKWCPDTCPLKDGGGCYAETGPQSWQWRKVGPHNDKSLTEEQFINAVRRLPDGRFWRHNVAGDFKNNNGQVDKPFIYKLVKANKNKLGFTFTHHDLSDDNVKLFKFANSNGFTINASTNSIDEVDKPMSLNIPTVTLLPEGSPKVQVTKEGWKVVKCPWQNNKRNTCDKCRLCADPNRSFVIGFEAHGARKRKVTTLAQGV